jgi:hypothetical protein
MYDILHVLHVSLSIPLMLYSWFLSGVFGFVQCCIVFVHLNAIFMLVYLKRLVSFLICGLGYVKVAHFLFSSLSCFWWIFCCICVFRFEKLITTCRYKIHHIYTIIQNNNPYDLEFSKIFTIQTCLNKCCALQKK